MLCRLVLPECMGARFCRPFRASGELLLISSMGLRPWLLTDSPAGLVVLDSRQDTSVEVDSGETIHRRATVDGCSEGLDRPTPYF